ncbi:manganese efflux pump MntP [Oribacterium sp. WCC10]|uniref:manganese efflux pump MntP n=1 Tax=Oribacterium sp. WCC10 TaxID=1855343 RepID=UPI0008EB0B3F|nr:manganese efflux pump [Oribacterium sp. WCC10]SFG32009.1 Putative Mn2+ efflux pump MntP [Oribacterium sp. WCC10]
MTYIFGFIVNGVLLGIGLAMDAFSVSLANGLRNTGMNRREMTRIAGCFALFQFLMPIIGWGCIHSIVLYFQSFQKYIPWIALLLLSYIGGKMLWEGFSWKDDSEENKTDLNTNIAIGTLIMQGIATSIDALSVGFTIADYHAPEAFVTSCLIAVTTFIICMFGLKIGRIAGTKLSGKANILGGLILIGIGIEIFVSNMF